MSGKKANDLNLSPSWQQTNLGTKINKENADLIYDLIHSELNEFILSENFPSCKK